MTTVDIKPIIDSKMTFDEAVAGTKAPKDIIASLCLLEVYYFAFDGRLHQGQLVVHREVEKDVIELFKLIELLKFPVARVLPIVKYDWLDNESMADNNTSAFNYRFVMGTERFSHHACGRALDINPYLNPVIDESGRIDPPGATYLPERPGTFFEAHPVVREFMNRGWRWGGKFSSSLDYHHFDKPM